MGCLFSYLKQKGVFNISSFIDILGLHVSKNRIADYSIQKYSFANEKVYGRVVLTNPLLILLYRRRIIYEWNGDSIPIDRGRYINLRAVNDTGWHDIRYNTRTVTDGLFSTYKLYRAKDGTLKEIDELTENMSISQNDEDSCVVWKKDIETLVIKLTDNSTIEIHSDIYGDVYKLLKELDKQIEGGT